MKVILLQEIPKLGQAGEVKNVSDGFARNFLIPRMLAEPATEANLKALNQRLTAKAARQAKERAGHQALAEKLKLLELRFILKTGEKGQAFGSITAQDIAEELAKNGITVEKNWIEMEHGIRAAGEHSVPVRLPHHITAELKITAESEL